MLEIWKYLPKGACFFQKTWFLSNFGPHFRFRWQKSATFCHKARETFENFEKSTSASGFFSNFSNFAIFGPHFHQLFATRRVKPWKFWKNSWLPAEIELLPVEIPRKLVKFSKLFAKILRWSLENLNLKTGNGNRPTSCEFLSLPVEKSTSVSDFYQFCHFQTPMSPTFCQNTK